MGMIPIQSGDLKVGGTLPWPVYDSNQRLLLKKGALISSSRQLDSLLMRGIYRAASETVEVTEKKVEDTASPFERIDQIMRKMPGVFDLIETRAEDTATRIGKIADELIELCAAQPDAMIGVVHLSHEFPYTVCHAVHTAILCAILADRIDCKDERKRSVVCAALTQNVAMRKLQEHLQTQDAPLNDAQRAQIASHPARALKLLRDAGVTDEVWLQAVLQHHERVDGSGYPRGLKGEHICKAAQVLSLADRYGAMISSRTYRDQLAAKDVLKEFFLTKGSYSAEPLTLTFIRELGVYPPGSFVALSNGERGIVIKRGQTGHKPIVSAYLGAKGQVYPGPFRRVCGVEDVEVRETFEPDPSSPINLTTIWAVR